ncbi:MAG: DUF4335 domain-containing protein [Cyanobacteria bacterium P01_A01_bin.114]
MTIQRQYVLPNCSLIIEGLSNNSTSDVLSLLASAECKFVGIEQSIGGGLAFFQSLVETISQYTQALLSGLPHPPPKSKAPIVQLKPGEGPYHHLIVQPESEPSEKAASQETVDDIKLSTVQLFDLAEAVDQFFADTQTLPDLKLQLLPLSRRHVRPSEPLAQRATPPLLGLGALAIAAAGLFWLPIPEIPEPRSETEQNSLSTAETPSSLENTDSDAPEDVPEDAPENAPGSALEAGQDPIDESGSIGTITDSDQISALQDQLQDQLDSALIDNPEFEDALPYRVSVAANGDIVGYRAESEAALANIDQTPLPQLTYVALEEEPTAQFQVVFNPDGSATVLSLAAAQQSSLEPRSIETDEPEIGEPEINEPEVDEAEIEDTARDEVDDSTETASSTPQRSTAQLPRAIENKIDSADQIATLNTQLRRDIVENRERREFGERLEYQVRLAADGTVVGYEAYNDAAETFVAETPLPTLPQTADPDLPQTDFLVVITEGGIVQVSPWSGW